MTDEVMRALGRIEGKLEAMVLRQTEHTQSLAGMDSRVAGLEVRAGKAGMLSGGIMAVGVTLLTETLKKQMGL